MNAMDALGFVGHRIHIARGREARILFDWLGDISGRSLLDVAGGDGYWAGRTIARGAAAFSLDIDARRIERGRRYSTAPVQVRGDALRLPFADRSFDAVMSISSIEHLGSAATAIAEMARVLRPGGSLVLSADSLAGRERWPKLAAAHDRRYGVVRPIERRELEELLVASGLEPLRATYLFKKPWTNRVYLELSRSRLAWNAAAPFSPLIALSDRREDSDSGSIVLVHARRHL